MAKSKKKLLVTLIAIITMCLCVAAILVYSFVRDHKLDVIQAEAIAELDAREGEYDEKYIVLYETSKAKAEELAELYGAKLRITENGRFARIELPEGVTIRDIYSEKEYRQYIEEMDADFSVSMSEIEAEEGKHERYPLAPQSSVSDTDFAKQSYLNYLNMQNVWNRYTGSGITVAVIDTGIDTDHPEFTGRISEYSYNATEDKIVKDYTLEDGSYDWSLVEDEQGHGTAVTGVIAASMNSGNIIGIAPRVNIITIKAECDENGNFKRTSDLVFGLYYAIERDVSVVNMSFGSTTNEFEEVLQLAYDSDVICVASAGNDSTSELHYPAADKNCIGVGALAEGSWTLADYSNYGENTNIVAPGTTYTTAIGGGYKVSNGTSLSSPIVTGAIALLMQTDKYLTFDEVTELLYASAYDIGNAGPDWDFGYGALDVNSLVQGQRGTVTFDMLTDELENTKQVFIKGNVLQVIPEPERNYSVFDGWYYDEQCTEEFVYYEDVFADDVTLYAKWTNEDDGVPYTYVILDDGTVEIRSYTGKRRFITIPEKIDGRIVSSIGDKAFADQTRLREIWLPSGLTNIGRYAFENCANLVSMEIPEGVTNIGEYAFSGAVRLSNIVFEDNSQLRIIGRFAFENCGKLERIELPKNLESIYGSAFYGTTSLGNIDVRSGNSNYVDIDGVLFNKNKSTIVAYPSDHGNEYDIPEGVSVVGEFAFAKAKISAIDFDGVTSIENNAFVQSNLETITIPDSVVKLGGAVFKGNSFLSEVYLGKGITTIPSEAFKGCSKLENITIPNSIVTIDVEAFYSSGLTTVDFEDNSKLRVIADSAFSSIELTKIMIPDSVVEIGSKAFAGNVKLNEVIISSNSNLQTIGAQAFAATYSLSNIEFPDNLKSIGGMAFMGSGLTGTVSIPANVTEIGYGAFASCSLLTNIDVSDENAVYRDNDGVVYTLDNTALHTYPAGRSETSYTVNGETISIMSYSFTGTVKLTKVTLPVDLEQIAERAFNMCTSLQSVKIPDNVTQIGRYAFADCWKLTSITFNTTSKLPRISYAAFAYSGITSFTVPANVSTMAQYVFDGCSKLTSVTFAENSKLESISAYTFSGCGNISTLTFKAGSNLNSIQAHALEGMTKIQKLDFSNTKLTNIDNFAFRFCEKLSSVKLTDTVTNIGRYAFYGCESMAELSVPATLEHIGPYAFLGTKNMNIYFAGETLPLYIDEYWDHGITGYYLGVTNITTSGDFKYATMTSGGIGIIEYTGSATELDLTTCDFGGDITVIGGSAFKDSAIESVVIPETVTTIQAEAFAYSALKSVSIPQSVQFIGREAFAYTPIENLTFAEEAAVRVIEQYAFEKTTKLETVTIPASVEIMGTGVFKNSGLTSVTFADNIKLEEIPQNAFSGTKLESVTIPDSVSLVNHNAFNGVKTLKSVDFGNNENLRIMSNVFYHTGLTSLHIPANVTYIGEYAFVGIKSLKTITVDEANPNYKSEDGLLLNKTGRKLINVPAGREGSLVVPISVEEIGFGAFEESKLSTVKFEANANILTFGNRSFFKAENITEITVPASVVSIDYYAFAYCPKLEIVNFAEGNKLKGIYEGAFCGDNNLKNITLPDSIVEISDFAFYGCSKLTQIPMTETSEVKGIYDYAFAYSGLAGEFTLSEQIIDVGEYAFLACDFTKITVPDANAKQLIIGLGAFEECNKLEEITLPFIGASYEDFELSWFGYIFGAGAYSANDTYVPDSLKTVTITEGISFVGIGGFTNIASLEQINMPHSVSTLYNEAFSGTKAVYELTNEIRTVYYDNRYLKEDDTNIKAYFGQGIEGSIKLWDGAKEIDSFAFEKCRNLIEVVLPDNVTSIGTGAFGGCYDLSSISWPENLINIGNSAFLSCRGLTSIIIPDSVQTIEYGAFQQCDGLKNIIIPDSVTYLGEYAFGFCKGLANVELSSNLNKIERCTFINCINLMSVTVSENITTVGDSAFYGCKRLCRVVNNSSLLFEIGSTANGYIAFYANEIVDKDGNILNGSGSQFVDTDDGFRFVNDGGTYKLIAYLGEEDTITLPTDINGEEYSIYKFTGGINVVIPYGITTIGKSAFQDCSTLKSIKIPDSVTSIGIDAFANCTNLKSIIIPNSVTTLEGAAFSGCDELSHVKLSDNIVAVGNNSFYDCRKLKFISIPEGVTSIGKEAFSGCASLESLVLPDSLKSIGYNAFSGCYKISINIPKNVSTIGTKAFSPSSKVTLSSENSNLQMVDGILYDKPATKIIAIFDCAGENINILEGVTYIGSEFSYNNAKSITLPDSLKTIGDNAFRGCNDLENINIPKNVSSISSSAYIKNATVYLDEENSSYQMIDGVLYNKSLTKIIAVTGNVPETIIIPEGIKTLGEAFYGNKSIISVILPNSISKINDSAFYACTSLTKIVIPDSVTSIGHGAFYNNKSLAKIDLPSSLKSIGSSAFQSCSSLTSITIPENVESIDYAAFSTCDKLLEVINLSDLEITIGNEDHGMIGYHANVIVDKNGAKTYRKGYETFEYINTSDGFRFIYQNGKYKLLSYVGDEYTVTLPSDINGEKYSIYRFCGAVNLIISDGIGELSSRAFEGSGGLKSVIISDGVTKIGSYAFSECINLTNVQISNSVTNIDSYAFYRCSNLVNVSISDSVESIGVDAFSQCSKIYSNPKYRYNGNIIIDGWLVDVDDNSNYITNDNVKNIVVGAYNNCEILKNAWWYGDISGVTNIKTLVVPNITSQNIPYVETLENIVVTGDIGVSELQKNLKLFKNVSGITIYVEANEEELRWDDNFPGWNNGNKVVYGDKWNWVKFCDEDGNILLYEPKTTSQIVRLPAENSYADDNYIISGWDINDDGVADVIPATTTEEINAVAILECAHKDMIMHEGKLPTCTERGWKEYGTCANCGYSTYEEISQIDHEYVDGNCWMCGYVEPDYMLGDVCADGVINALDAVSLKVLVKELVTPTEEEKLAADINKNGSINVDDMMLLKLRLVRDQWIIE